MDIVALILSTITAMVSAVATILTYINGKKTAYGNIELQIRSMISDAKYHLLEFSYKFGKNENDIDTEQFDALIEEVLNAYDEACAKYLDRKVDRDRFKKMYYYEIIQTVENEEYQNYYSQTNSKYGATLKVYKQFIPHD